LDNPGKCRQGVAVTGSDLVNYLKEIQAIQTNMISSVLSPKEDSGKGVKVTIETPGKTSHDYARNRC